MCVFEFFEDALSSLLIQFMKDRLREMRAHNDDEQLIQLVPARVHVHHNSIPTVRRSIAYLM